MTIDASILQFPFEIFFLTFARIISFLTVAPVFSMRGIPAVVKITLALVLTVMVFGMLPEGNVNTSSSVIAFALLIVREVIIGLSVGYLGTLIFAAISMGGQFIDFQMGLSIGAVYDPATQSQSTLFGSLYNWMALLLLFAIDGHHWIMRAIVGSFNRLPAGVVNMSDFAVGDIVKLFTNSLLTAFQISVPILIVLILTDIIMGVIARTVPQLQIFILAIPIKIMLGILFLLAMANITFMTMVPILEQIPQVVERALGAFM